MIRSPARTVLTALSWILVVSAAGAAVGVAAGALQPGPLDPTDLWISVLFANVVGLTVWFAAVGLSPRLGRLGTVARASILGAALLSGAVAGTVLIAYLFPLTVLRDPRRAAAVAAINAVLAIVVGGVVHAYEGMRRRLADSLREVEEVRLVESRLREEAARAELNALQARINPHFFFNTLNTISALLEESPARADEVLQELAELFRYTFRAATSGPVALSEELEFVRRYLAIEQTRFGDRLRVEERVDPDALRIQVPGLILQPLVENAVGHGLSRLACGGRMWIRAGVSEDGVVIEVEDDGVGLAGPAEDLIREHHGLGNVRRRLATLYSGEAALELMPGPDGRGALARLRLPHRAPRTAVATEIASGRDGEARA